MTERAPWNWLEGMIVKTGLQDVTKNVRIYGTISAASSPSARPLHAHLANRSPVPLFHSPPHPRLDLLYESPYRRRIAKRASFLLPLLARRCAPPSLLLFLSSRSHPLRPPSSSPPTSHAVLVGDPTTTTDGRAQRGAIAPTAAGTTLMLH